MVAEVSNILLVILEADVAALASDHDQDAKHQGSQNCCPKPAGSAPLAAMLH
jgi:hypothetical protein